MDIEIVRDYCLDILKRIDNTAYVYITKETYTVLAIGDDFALLYAIENPQEIEICWDLAHNKKIKLGDQNIEDEIRSIYRQYVQDTV